MVHRNILLHTYATKHDKFYLGPTLNVIEFGYFMCDAPCLAFRAFAPRYDPNNVS